MTVLKYNVNTNTVETSIDVVVKAMKSAREEREEIIALAKVRANEYNYTKIYGEKECVAFELEMWKKGNKTLVSSFYSKDIDGTMYKEFAWKE